MLTDFGDRKNVSFSNIWIGIAFGVKLVAKGLRCRVGDVSLIRSWIDDWVLSIGMLKDHATIILNDSQLDQCMREFLLDREWQLQFLATVLRWDVIHKIACIHVGRPYSGDDRVIWSWSENGEFSVKSTYIGYLEIVNLLEWRWNFIWKLKIPFHIIHFL